MGNATTSARSGSPRRSREPARARRRARERDFSDLVAALDDFTAKALVDSQPPGDAVKKAYAALYEKAFRYEFYEGYEPKPSVPGSEAEAVRPPAPSRHSPAPKSAAARMRTRRRRGAKAAAAPVSEMTRAKNRFGALLDAMPPDKLHEIHAAFGKIVDVQPIASDHELEIYRYAIFVLEPPAPPPRRRGACARRQAVCSAAILTRRSRTGFAAPNSVITSLDVRSRDRRRKPRKVFSSRAFRLAVLCFIPSLGRRNARSRESRSPSRREKPWRSWATTARENPRCCGFSPR